MQTQAERDAAYENAAHIPDGAGFPAVWAARAGAFRDAAGGRFRGGIAYGPGPREMFDLVMPHRQGPRGVVVFVHGGYWQAFGREDWTHLAAGAVAHGFAVAIPSYDLCPDVRISTITHQVAQAIGAIAQNVGGPIHLTGHSAGGQLVARMLAPGMLTDSVAARLAMVVPISPVADLRPLMGLSMNRQLRLDAQEAATESPVLMADRLAAVPVAVHVGAAERPVFIDNARGLATAWNAPLSIASQRHHFNVIDALADPQSDLMATLLNQ